MIPGLQAPALIVPGRVRNPPAIIRRIITPDELWREPSRMVRLALTPVQTTGKVNTDSAASTTLTLNGVTAGNLLVVQTCVDQLVTTALAAPTGFSTAEAPVGQLFSSNNANCVGIFYKENSGSGTQSATVNAASGSSNYFTSSMTEWAITGTGNLDVHTNNGSASATSGDSGTTGTTAQATELCFAVICINDLTDVLSGLTDASGFTDIFLEATDSAHAAGNAVYKNLAATGTQIANWTWTNSGAYSAAIATFKATSADTLMAQICL